MSRPNFIVAPAAGLMLRVGLALSLGVVGFHSAFAQDGDDGSEGTPAPPPMNGLPGSPDRIRPMGGALPMPMGQPPGGLPGNNPNMGGEGGSKQGQSIAPVGDAQGEGGPANVTAQRAPCVESKGKIAMDYVDAPVSDVVKYMAEITCKNFIIKDDLSGKITIISHQQVSVSEAYEAFLSALEVAGYTTVTVGKNTKVVPTTEAANTPLKIYQTDDDLPATDNFVTQIIQLENVPVSEMASVVKELAGSKVRVVAYAPTNTLIVTDSSYNIRRVYKIVSQLDVAAPKSKLVVLPLKYATATDVEKILEEVYGVTAASTSSSSTSSTAPRETAASRRRKKEGEAATPAAGAGGSATSVGSEGVFISKIISDERTNSLILLANEEALADVQGLIGKLDVDIDPSSRSQIHVVYLANAKASDVAGVLQDLSQSTTGGSSSRSSSGSSSSRSSGSRSSGNSNSSRSGSSGSSGRSGGSSSSGGSSGGSSRGGFGGGMPGGAPGDAPGLGGGTNGLGSTGVVAAFDNGMRVTADENTNSLVVIAAPEDFRVLKQVIDKLDIMRRQVFVEAVVLEVGSEDEFDFGIGYHLGAIDGSGTTSFASSQLNGSSIGLNLADALSGLAMGVFGQSIDIPYTDSTTGTTSTLAIPAFGIAINALASNSGVDILSNPSLLIVDNEEAKINVGRNVPFPVSSGRDSNNNPVVSYQREDVGIELKVTPQINESNFVTMELTLTVAEVEEDSSGLDVSTAGFITSERETENVVVVQDNQTIVIGGLIGNTQTKVETKVPILGDIPLIGALFRGNRNTERKTNLLIFMTPHVINEPADLEEVYRVKWLQRQEFIRRFYGKSRDQQQEELGKILAGSMNMIDQPSQYRVKAPPVPREEVLGVTPESSTTILPPTGQTSGSPPAPEGN